MKSKLYFFLRYKWTYINKVHYLSGIKKFPQNRAPHFGIIGLPKAATGWLTTALRSNPDFFYGVNWKPRRAELNYFNRYFVHPLEKYSQVFKGGEAKIRFEKSPGYASMPIWKIKFIKQLFPEFKPILILRDPVDRSFSHAKMELLKKGRYQFNDISDEAFYRAYEKHANKLNYRLMWDNWKQIFGEDLLLIDYQSLSTNPEGLLQQVCDHIGYNGLIKAFKLGKKAENKTPSVLLPDSHRAYLENLNQDNINFYNQIFGKGQDN